MCMEGVVKINGNILNHLGEVYSDKYNAFLFKFDKQKHKTSFV